METHFLSTDEHTFSEDERELITRLPGAAMLDVRSYLPQLPNRMHLLVEPGAGVIDVTGELGFTLAPYAIRWTVDSTRDVSSVASTHLRRMLAHDCHHAARLIRFPAEAYLHEWRSGVVFEGLATVFERDIGVYDPPWGQYDAETVAVWARELFAQPVDHTYSQWKFNHPDGRQWIAYRVGAWVVDQACEQAGTTAAQLVWTDASQILEMAKIEV